MDNDDEFELNPPAAAEVVRRAAIVKFHFAYVASMPPSSIIAVIAEKWTPAERAKFAANLESSRRQFVEQLRSTGLWEDTSPSERAIFEQPPSAITDRQRVIASWRAEAAHCLAWALRLVEDIPGYDTLTDPKVVMPLIPTTDLANYCRSAALRDRAEIERAREIAELWHWRSRSRQLQNEGYQPPPGQPAIDTVIREMAPGLAAEGMLPAAIDGDFPALGRAYRALSEEEWVTVRSIAMERHFALNWLSGYAPNNEWDETTTDT